MEFGQDLEIAWRSFLLRPEPDPSRSLEKFKKYTESWKRPASMEPETVFRVWATEEGPPSHSIPPHLAVKAAACIGPEAFEQMHERLFKAYFSENRNITEENVLRELWLESGLPIDAMEKTKDMDLLREIIAEHNEALANGVTGVPAVRKEGGFGVLIGAEPEETYRRLISRT
ncbi:MAG: DsbA family protein [Deltaproteobacteria bacterium]|nr:DsbA family protein [Deltaproteobacteria bacterium]